ncbi:MULTISPECIES: ATP-binding protein [unclassified Achromobacter]|uniref:ATP-binding protein n=1 Tax=unclassified Achromobacter TaxID=2626865 RepID=UPI000B51664E|nr:MULTISPECIES: ATP-binding protein [unclassified Achromobacter]OWT74682.1 two-component sensor histidine kinase [Achromobacter sp. HZ34]OWT79149.1 two-component sensor histidine kinase [Achromobacter sp. HZ28]
MTLQRRLIIAVLLAAPLAWMLTIAATYWRAHHEINELYDTDMVRLAGQTIAVAALLPHSDAAQAAPLVIEPKGDLGNAGLDNVALTIWRASGEPLVVDPVAGQFPRGGDRDGFVDSVINGAPWRLYYVHDEKSGISLAVGQRMGERDELILAYVISQIVPWLIGLPILLALLYYSVRRALRPMTQISSGLERRSPDDQTPLPEEDAPGELRALLRAMNGLLRRVGRLIDQERRLTADAAHELRTPLAALRAQWEVLQRADDGDVKRESEERVTRGLERLDRLVSQLLTMARLDSTTRANFGHQVNWRTIIDQAVSDCLWLSNRRDVDIDVEWPDKSQAPLPIAGDTDALAILLRNLLDNAIRYGPCGGRVRVVLTPTRIFVDDQGEGIDADLLPRLGDRFFRAAGNQEAGSGLGVSIAMRIAQNHGLVLRYSKRETQPGHGPDAFGNGMRVTLMRG